jgi:protein PhnA
MNGFRSITGSGEAEALFSAAPRLPSFFLLKRKHHMDIKVRDSNGALLAEGDTVTLIKDLKLKGSSTVIKRGTVIKNIHLTDDPDEIEGRTDKVKGLVLRTEFLKKG